MAKRLPSVRLTPDQIFGTFRELGHRPTITEVEQWLLEHRRDIQEGMEKAVAEHLKEILEDAMLSGYPEVAFDQQYHAVDGAILDAAEAYATRVGREEHGNSHTETEMVSVIRRMLSQSRLSVCMAYEFEFAIPGAAYDNRVITHRTRRVHLEKDGEIVTATLIEDDNCQHTNDVFLPESIKLMN